MNQLMLSIPGLNIKEQSPGYGQLTIRGISQEVGGAATSAIYIDETPLLVSIPGTDPVAPDIRMFDMERVEVLRGPQGTLYGEGALGGMLRFVAKKPNPTKFEGATSAEYFGFSHGGDGYSTDLMLNAPIFQDKLAVRVVGYYRDQDGYIDDIQLAKNDINDFDVFSGRVALRYLGEKMTVDVSGIRQSLHAGAVIQQANKEYEAITYTKTPQNDEYDSYNFTINYDLDDVQIVSSSSYLERRIDYISDVSSPDLLGLLDTFFGDFIGGQGFQSLSLFTDDQHFNSYTQELRLVSSSDSHFQWTLGAYYKNVNTLVHEDTATLPRIPINLFNAMTKTDIEQYAVFGEALFDVTERFHITAGLRWFHENQNNKFSNDGVFASPVIENEIPLTYKVWQPKLSLSYDINHNAMIYATVSKGFRSGGANSGSEVIRDLPVDQGGDPTASDTYGPEVLWNYEAGAKGSLFDGKVVGSLSVFYMKWSSMQLVGNPENPVFQYTDNIGSAHSQGVEMDATFKPLDRLSVQLGLQLLEAEIDDGSPDISKGETLVGAPTYKVSLSGEYVFPFSFGADGVLRADYTVSDGAYATLPNSSFPKTPDYDVLNLRASLDFDQWSVSLFAENVFDSFLPVEASINTKPGYQGYFILPPRRVGISVSARF